MREYGKARLETNDAAAESNQPDAVQKFLGGGIHLEDYADTNYMDINLELHEPYNNITSIQVKIKKGEKEHEIKWLNKNYYNEG